MERPTVVYLLEPIVINEDIVIRHTQPGLIYMIELMQNTLTMNLTNQQLRTEHRDHMLKLIENYTIQLQLYQQQA